MHIHITPNLQVALQFSITNLGYAKKELTSHEGFSGRLFDAQMDSGEGIRMITSPVHKMRLLKSFLLCYYEACALKEFLRSQREDFPVREFHIGFWLGAEWFMSQLGVARQDMRDLYLAATVTFSTTLFYPDKFTQVAEEFLSITCKTPKIATSSLLREELKAEYSRMLGLLQLIANDPYEPGDTDNYLTQRLREKDDFLQLLEVTSVNYTREIFLEAYLLQDSSFLSNEPNLVFPPNLWTKWVNQLTQSKTSLCQVAHPESVICAADEIRPILLENRTQEIPSAEPVKVTQPLQATSTEEPATSVSPATTSAAQKSPTNSEPPATDNPRPKQRASFWTLGFTIFCVFAVIRGVNHWEDIFPVRQHIMEPPVTSTLLEPRETVPQDFATQKFSEEESEDENDVIGDILASTGENVDNAYDLSNDVDNVCQSITFEECLYKIEALITSGKRKEGTELLEQLALDHREARAAQMLMVMYNMSYLNTPKDPVKAKYWYDRYIDLTGGTEFRKALDLFDDGKDLNPAKWAEIRPLLDVAIQKGRPEAAFCLGFILTEGIPGIVQPDYATARSLLKKACDGGFEPAEPVYARYLQFGMSGERNVSEAERIRQKLQDPKEKSYTFKPFPHPDPLYR